MAEQVRLAERRRVLNLYLEMIIGEYGEITPSRWTGCSPDRLERRVEAILHGLGVQVAAAPSDLTSVVEVRHPKQPSLKILVSQVLPYFCAIQEEEYVLSDGMVAASLTLTDAFPGVLDQRLTGAGFGSLDAELCSAASPYVDAETGARISYYEILFEWIPGLPDAHPGYPEQKSAHQP